MNILCLFGLHSKTCTSMLQTWTKAGDVQTFHFCGRCGEKLKGFPLVRTGALVIALSLMQGCATPDRAHPDVPLGGIVAIKGEGYKLETWRKDYEVDNGVDANLFYPWKDAKYPWFISEENEPKAANERDAARNPMPKK